MDKKTISRILAIYLPQFHTTEDNNKWWGDGFTDWESVKSAEPCFDGHNVPWAPMGNQYYDLSNPETLKYQAELAKKYGIGGFCFYHYYFKNGKKNWNCQQNCFFKISRLICLSALIGQVSHGFVPGAGLQEMCGQKNMNRLIKIQARQF